MSTLLILALWMLSYPSIVAWIVATLLTLVFIAKDFREMIELPLYLREPLVIGLMFQLTIVTLLVLGCVGRLLVRHPGRIRT